VAEADQNVNAAGIVTGTLTAGLFHWATKFQLFLDSEKWKFSNKILSWR